MTGTPNNRLFHHFLHSFEQYNFLGKFIFYMLWHNKEYSLVSEEQNPNVCFCLSFGFYVLPECYVTMTEQVFNQFFSICVGQPHSKCSHSDGCDIPLGLYEHFRRQAVILHSDRSWGITRSPCNANQKKVPVTCDTVKSGFRLNSKFKVKKVDAELQVEIGCGDASLLSSVASREANSELYLFIEGWWFSEYLLICQNLFPIYRSTWLQHINSSGTDHNSRLLS